VPTAHGTRLYRSARPLGWPGARASGLQAWHLGGTTGAYGHRDFLSTP
jgi:hypothetical protein